MSFDIGLPRLKVTKDELLSDLKRVAELEDKIALKRTDYEKHGKFSYTSFRNHFGSWKKALETAGLQRGRNWGSTNESLLDNLKDIWIKLGRQPKYSEMVIPFSKYSATTYAHKFGNWTNALIAFQQYLENDEVNTDLATSISSQTTINKRRTKRDPNWRLRFKVMQRNSFRCVVCGRSPAKDPDIVLHVDHIKPWSKGGETEIGNLQTLCKVCNLGKGDFEQ